MAPSEALNQRMEEDPDRADSRAQKQKAHDRERRYHPPSLTFLGAHRNLLLGEQFCRRFRDRRAFEEIRIDAAEEPHWIGERQILQILLGQQSMLDQFIS